MIQNSYSLFYMSFILITSGSLEKKSKMRGVSVDYMKLPPVIDFVAGRNKIPFKPIYVFVCEYEYKLLFHIV